jgi:hypothetical protein
MALYLGSEQSFAGLHGNSCPSLCVEQQNLGDEHTLALCSGQVAIVIIETVRSAQALELHCSELQLTEKWNPALAADVTAGGPYSAARGLLDLAMAATALQVPRSCTEHLSTEQLALGGKYRVTVKRAH